MVLQIWIYFSLVCVRSNCVTLSFLIMNICLQPNIESFFYFKLVMLTVLIEAEKTSLRPNFSRTSAENLTEAPSFSLSGLSPHKLFDLPDQSLSHSYSSETSPSPRLSSTKSSGNQFFQSQPSTFSPVDKSSR